MGRTETTFRADSEYSGGETLLVTGRPYFELIGAAADHLVNFFNPEDFALSFEVWMANQDTKPDGGSYDPETATWYWGLVNSTEVTFPSDRYKIFAFLAEAESLPLGRQPGVDGPFEPSKQVDLNAQFGFGGGMDTSHSAQFLATNMIRWQYWKERKEEEERKEDAIRFSGE